MRKSLSERNVVIALFVLVFIIFAFAHEDSKKLKPLYSGGLSSALSEVAALQQTQEFPSVPALPEKTP